MTKNTKRYFSKYREYYDKAFNELIDFALLNYICSDYQLKEKGIKASDIKKTIVFKDSTMTIEDMTFYYLRYYGATFAHDVKESDTIEFKTLVENCDDYSFVGLYTCVCNLDPLFLDMFKLMIRDSNIKQLKFSSQKENDFLKTSSEFDKNVDKIAMNISVYVYKKLLNVNLNNFHTLLAYNNNSQLQDLLREVKNEIKPLKSIFLEEPVELKNYKNVDKINEDYYVKELNRLEDILNSYAKKMDQEIRNKWMINKENKQKVKK